MSRPELLFPLFAGLETLEGIGPKTAKSMTGLGASAPRDLLFTLPIGVVDRRLRPTVQGCALPATLTVQVRVKRHSPPSRRAGPYRVVVEDSEITFAIVFFNARDDYLSRILPIDADVVVSGKVELFDGVPQMVHPDYTVLAGQPQDFPDFEPIYPLTAGVTQKVLRRAIAGSLTRVPDFPEWIDPGQMQATGWPSFREAIEIAHAPQSDLDLAASAPARMRLAYDEFLAHQMTLALARLTHRRQGGAPTIGTGALRSKVETALPYAPTGAQRRAIKEVADDMAAPMRMNRLLQGDVGSGKTLVALMTLLIAVEAGGQGALMAPTEILARQHLAGLKPLADAAGVTLDILTGRDKGAERRAKLARLADGRIQILVGTHALFQADVVFHDLRLAIVDEQHRFGVRQRLELGRKGRSVDVLVMTATPIPRSLALVGYGDMDISVLDEKPPGRKPIQTAMVSTARLGEVVERLRAAIAQGRQCYWVCPLVEESEILDLTAAEDRFAWLRAALGDGVVGLVHGQMPVAEKDAAMALFESGGTKVLVATTVIEVGVNVPNATIMVIERAETFGLAQLHQLRGRVGRGAAASTCLLLYQAPLSQTGRKRLEVLRDTEDGFHISEVDMKMRGFGDLIGTAQSGVPRFQVADIEAQAAVMATAQSDAHAVLTVDPHLTEARGQAVRLLMWLMRRDEAFRLISVG